jgi:hypothetical protein
MKKNYKTILGLLVLFCFSLLILVTNWMRKEKEGSDYRIGVIADNGIALVSISKERKMVNVLKTEAEYQIWIPKGMGWYRSEVIKRILQQENKEDLTKDILFYNFGFVADEIVNVKKVDDWKNKFWWRLRQTGNYLNKEEWLKVDVNKNDDFLDKVMVRDFSETKVANEDLKISVINLSEANGLANFMTKIIERMGFSVISVTSDEQKDIGECNILYGDEVEQTYSWRLINKIFNCKKEKDSSLNENEIEFYFDDNFSTMIKYPSYKK